MTRMGIVIALGVVITILLIRFQGGAGHFNTYLIFGKLPAIIYANYPA